MGAGGASAGGHRCATKKFLSSAHKGVSLAGSWMPPQMSSPELVGRDVISLYSGTAFWLSGYKPHYLNHAWRWDACTALSQSFYSDDGKMVFVMLAALVAILYSLIIILHAALSGLFTTTSSGCRCG